MLPPSLKSARHWRICAHQLRHTSSSNNPRRTRLTIPPPFPVVPTCPAASCACAPMPAGLDIDRAQPLSGTMAAYAQQVLVSTGRSDWTSRIEDDGAEEGWGRLTRGLKGLLGRGGKYMDPYNNVLVTGSSLASAAPSDPNVASALLLPSFHYLPSIPTDPASLDDFTSAFLLPPSIHKGHATLPPPARTTIHLRDPAKQSRFPTLRTLRHTPIVLICGHGGRDERCGVMGPLLQAEFARVLERRGFRVADEPVDEEGAACVAQISHVGGHKYAGNVIVYVPPALAEEGNQLAGAGVWYGRVEPKHVEGIVETSLFEGKVIADQFRGGIGLDGGLLAL